jgi:hypothetical protein
METTLTPEEIEKNWHKMRSLLEKLGDRSTAALNMVDSLGERLALCPASAKRDYHSAYPGGLVEHSLRVLGNAMKITGAFGWKIPKDSLIIGALFHDIGKVGNHEKDYYVPQTDGWRAEKLGEEYTYNKDMQYMTVPVRGLFLCQHYGLRLTEQETLAILLNDGQYAEENAAYKLKEPMLADVVHMADLIATKQEKGILPH